MPCAGKCYSQIECKYRVHMYFTCKHCIGILLLRQTSVLRSTNAWDCQAEHHEELGYHTLLYQTVELGVKAFKNSTVSTITCIETNTWREMPTSLMAMDHKQPQRLFWGLLRYCVGSFCCTVCSVCTPQ